MTVEELIDHLQYIVERGAGESKVLIQCEVTRSNYHDVQDVTELSSGGLVRIRSDERSDNLNVVGENEWWR